MTFEEGRALFPVLERTAYLNTGSVGPLATPVVAAMQAEEDRQLEHGRGSLAAFERAMGLREELRGLVAALVGAEVEQVALTGSTTDGCNIVAGWSRPRAGRRDRDDGLRALRPAGPAARLRVPRRRGGAQAGRHPGGGHRAHAPDSRLPRAVDDRGGAAGCRAARRSGVPVLADGAQSVGAIPVDVRGIDFYTVSGQKWLCGPDGAGALVVAEPERLRVARPSYLSQTAYEPDGSFTPRDGAARFDPNWAGTTVIAGLAAAIDAPAAVALRARCGDGSPLPAASRGPRRRAPRRRDPRGVPPTRGPAAERSRRRVARSRRRHPRAPGPQSAACLLRLVDERRRPGPARGGIAVARVGATLTQGGRSEHCWENLPLPIGPLRGQAASRPPRRLPLVRFADRSLTRWQPCAARALARSAATPRRRWRCARRAPVRAAPRRHRPRRGARPPRTTAA